MKLTDEQKEVLKHENNIAIESCPGSGKTHVVVSKLSSCLDEVKNSTRKVCCITYLNSAVHEINYRLSTIISQDDLSAHYDIGTIHSFCLNNIFHPSFWRIKKFSKGYRIITPDDEEYIELVRNIINDYSLDVRASDDFSNLRREQLLPYRISNLAAEEYWNYLDKNSLIDFNDIIYYSSHLVKEFNYTASGLASKYCWMIVDEFQDTSTYQVAILREIEKFKRTKFFLVGDPCQSIMGFVGGSPALMERFSENIGAEKSKKLSGNFRSSSNIVGMGETIISRNPPMNAVGVNKNFGVEPQWHINENIISGLEEKFFPLIKDNRINYGDCAILAPNFYLLIHVAHQLREREIPITGPGTRPYRKSNHIVAPLIEDVCLFIDTNNNNFIRVIRNKLFDLIKICESKWNFDVHTFKGDILINRIIYSAKSLKNISANACDFISKVSSELASLIFEYGFISNASQKMIKDSGKSLIEDIGQHLSREGLSVEDLTVENLSLFSNYGASVKLLTLHKAKGREFDAVAMINVEEGFIPYGNPSSRSSKEEEARRLFYVGVTRARKLLMFFTETRNHRNPSRFLGELFKKREAA